MRGSLIVLAACGLALTCGDAPGQSGWADLFPAAPPHYSLALDPPVVGGGENPGVYRQTARYDWTGDDFRQATATLARDPQFKTKYAAEAMKKASATETKVGKKTAWLRQTQKGGNQDCELIVPLSEDKALILTSLGNFGGETELAELAGRFDLARLEAALAKPPNADVKKDKEK